MPALSLDELRALVFYLARSDRHAGGYGLEGEELSLYLAAITRIHDLLAERAEALRE